MSIAIITQLIVMMSKLLFQLNVNTIMSKLVLAPELLVRPRRRLGARRPARERLSFPRPGVYIHKYIYIYIYIYTHTHTYVIYHMYIYIYIHTYVYMY